MALFAKLRAVRAYERRHLHFLRTLEDFDLVREIGYHQERGSPLTVKQLYLTGVASMATAQRRLRRLRHAGVVQQLRSTRDGRSLELRISPRVLRILGRYGEMLVGAKLET